VQPPEQVSAAMTVAMTVQLNVCAAENLQNEFLHSFSATTATAKQMRVLVGRVRPRGVTGGVV